MINQKIIKKKSENKREQYLSILKSVFEEEFPKQFTEEVLNKLIVTAIDNNEKHLDITLITHTGLNVYHLASFPLNIKLKENAYKKILGIFPKKIKYLNTNLKLLEDDLLFLTNYREILREITSVSPVFEEFKKNVIRSGYSFSVYYNYPTPIKCLIRIAW